MNEQINKYMTEKRRTTMAEERINIMTDVQSDLDRRFFIDCPVKTVMEGETCVRMEIPQELAKYIYELQSRNRRQEAEIQKLRKEIERLRTGLADAGLENAALRDALKEIDKQLPQEFDLLAVHIIEPALSTPSPQIAKIEAVLEAVSVAEKTGFVSDVKKVYEAFRNLRGDK